MEDAVNRALDYPYATPPFAYQFTAEGVERLESMPDLRGRHPVVGIGSNRSPVQLARKFARWSEELAIPVLPARLSGYDVVYSAHIASYGAVPATLLAQPGVIVDVAVLWLTADERAQMDATEALGVNYGRQALPPGSVDSAFTDSGDCLETYVSLHGPAYFDGQPSAIAWLRAETRRLPARHQSEVQDYLRQRVGARESFEDFVLSAVESRAVRAARARYLAASPAHAPQPRPIMRP